MIKLIEVKSEIAAGTRGASMGIDALKIACLDFNSDYFTRYDSEEVESMNEILFEENEHLYAKFIEGVHTMENRVCEIVYYNFKRGHFPLVLAGDHSTAYGTIAGLKKARPDIRLGVIWIDAHADIHSPYTTPSGNMHGMPLAMAGAEDNLESKMNEPEKETLEYWEKIKNIGGITPKINLSDVVYITVRDIEQPEQMLIDKYNIKNFTTPECRKLGMEKVALQALQKLNDCDYIYVSFDVDSLDSRLSEGTGTPVPNGLTVKEALDLNVALVKNEKVCCWEMVEVNPTLDELNKMAENAFQILEATTQIIEERVQ